MQVKLVLKHPRFASPSLLVRGLEEVLMQPCVFYNQISTIIEKEFQNGNVNIDHEAFIKTGLAQHMAE